MAHVYAFIHVEKGVYGISFPDFPGCISTADSLDDVLRRGEQALAFHIDGMAEDGAALPVLRNAEEIRADAALEEEWTGAIVASVPVRLPGKAMRINITMDEHLVAAIDRAAESRRESRSAFLARAAERRLVEG